uniref:SDR family NAD(P)-dependent oxidoreductase n=1 Tax=Microvirga soli TaxID=1854496 RepID=UPI0028A9C286|nr:SDR family NAD(P)-dependent oxidoreductase [Microvirga soli]
MTFDAHFPFRGQKALVTGASSGIGTAIATAFGTAGAATGVNYRSNPEEAERIVEAIYDAGSEAMALKADVASEDEVRTMFDAFGDAFGRIDILVANSGIQ